MTGKELVERLKETNRPGYLRYLRKKFYLKKDDLKKNMKKNFDNFIVFIAENYQKYFKKENEDKLLHVKTLRPDAYKRLMKQGFYRTINCACTSTYKNLQNLSRFDIKSRFSRIYGVKDTYPSVTLEDIVETKWWKKLWNRFLNQEIIYFA